MFNIRSGKDGNEEGLSESSSVFSSYDQSSSSGGYRHVRQAVELRSTHLNMNLTWIKKKVDDEYMITNL